MAKRIRGRRHPGVVLMKPEGRHGWRARYVDPDSGRTVKETLPAALTTAELRTDWAMRKSRALAQRRVELEGGALPTTGTRLEDAIERFYKDHTRLRPATVAAYKAATDKLRAWAKRTRLEIADDLTAPKLVAFAAELRNEPKRVRVKGKRGAVAVSERARSAWSVNRELRSVGRVLGHLRSLGLLPRLTSDGLRDALKKEKVDFERLAFCKPEALRKLLEAALRHDADTFEITRKGDKGTAPRYAPIAPLMACAMLTGMRRGELVALAWDRVDLTHDGEIHVTAASKTHRARTVDLSVSPALKALLARLHLAAGRPGEGSVFGLTAGAVVAAERRLVAEYGAPRGCGLQALRRTCGTFLTNAPGIFGAASAYRSARQLGHSVTIAERHYTGLVKVPADARTLEVAMGIEDQIALIFAVPAPSKKPVSGSRRRSETVSGA